LWRLQLHCGFDLALTPKGLPAVGRMLPKTDLRLRKTIEVLLV